MGMAGKTTKMLASAVEGYSDTWSWIAEGVVMRRGTLAIGTHRNKMTRESCARVAQLCAVFCSSPGVLCG